MDPMCISPVVCPFCCIFSNDGDDILLGGGASFDNIYGGENDDLVAGDCVYIQFNNDTNLVESFTSFIPDVGMADAIYGNNGNDILGEYI